MDLLDAWKSWGGVNFHQIDREIRYPDRRRDRPDRQTDRQGLDFFLAHYFFLSIDVSET
jgi:hypothetical protein